MNWLDDIFSLVFDIAFLFYDAYQEVSGWIWPFSLLQYPLYALYDTTFNLLSPISNFGDWLSDLGDTISGFLDASGILDLLADFIEYATWSWEWIQDFAGNITELINDWWTGASSIVLGWIDDAKAWAKTLIDAVVLSLGELRTEWDNFWTVTWPELLNSFDNLASAWDTFLTTTLPGLATWTGVGDLIESKLKEWFYFYDELAALWEDIKSFFVDPEAYLVKKIETMLERFW